MIQWYSSSKIASLKWVHLPKATDANEFVQNSRPAQDRNPHPPEGLRLRKQLTTYTDFIREHIELESLRLNKKEESATAKYQKDIPLPYKHFTGKEFLEFAENSPTYILTKLFSLDTFLSVVAVVFVILH